MHSVFERQGEKALNQRANEEEARDVDQPICGCYDGI
jgi:hypothetical protein